MTRQGYFAPALALWLAAEVVAFLAVAQALGLVGAILLGLGSSALGFALLRENFSATVAQVSAAFSGQAPQAGARGRETPQAGALAEGLIGALGALLLILPGFVSDVVGLALTTPSVRKTLADRVSSGEPLLRPERQTPPGVVDLNPGEWRVSDSSREGKSR